MDSRKTEDFGIYIHFPFCKKKCLYCGFYRVKESRANWNRFVKAVINEYKRRRVPESGIATLYMGGGTPSLAPVSVIRRFREMIPFEIGEFTIEVNPDDVTEKKARAWKEAGVNRVSMGVQSLIDEELKSIGRRHTAEQAMRAYDILRKYFSNISLDLMFGLPGQTIESLSFTIDNFLKMRPEHISAYSLMYEERASITRMRDSGMIEETDEDISVRMFRLISDSLKKAGYERYEISNYCLPGYRSHHNSNYWKGKPYIGLGPAAHSYNGKTVRFWNIYHVEKYQDVYCSMSRMVDTIEDREERDSLLKKMIDEIVEFEHLTVFEFMEEMIMTRLRMAEGLSLQEYRRKFGDSPYKTILSKSEKFLKSGDLFLSPDEHLILSDKGVMISDEIISSLF